jgi:iron complex transport system ATP-binding protein
MLEARNISVMIGPKKLVDDVSFSVSEGEVVAIIGPNGAGKSTLLRTLTGDTKPASGTVHMGDKPLNDWSRRDRARVRGVLAQQTVLTFAFTVLEVVLMGRSPHLTRGETQRDYEIAFDALEACHVIDLVERLYPTLSGGEQQRVQLARVLAQIWEPNNLGTRYLLLDEPTNNLDLAHQHSTLQVARQLAADGVAVLAILHDLNLAAQYADRIVVLHEGKNLMTGTPRQVLTPETIEHAFQIPVTVVPHPNLDCPLIVPGLSA